MTEVTKATPFADGKRRSMHMRKLTAVALTARGANPEANVTFFKSADKGTVEKQGDFISLATSIDDGHQHGIGIEVYDGELYINVMCASTPSGESHYHQIVYGSGGEYEVTMNLGHTHTVDAAAMQLALIDRFSKSVDTDTITKEKAATLIAVSNDGTLTNVGKNTMMTEEEKTALGQAQASLTATKSELVIATTLAQFTDADKAYYSALAESDKASFAKKTTAERSDLLDAIEKADSVEFTSKDGTAYRKSAGSVVINMAKQIDLQADQLQKQTALAKYSILAKRADDELGNMPGDTVTKTSLLNAIDGIVEEETRKAVAIMIKGANEAFTFATKTFGTSLTPEKQSSEDQLDTLAKTYATAHAVSNEEAYTKVLETAAGQALYNQAHS